MKYTNIIFFIILFIISCKKECNDIYYDFEIPATLSPALDTFKIGDTITVKIDFPDKVYNSYNGKLYKLENFKFYPIVSILEVSDTAYDYPSIYDFDLIFDEGTNLYPFSYDGSDIDYIGQYTYSDYVYSLGYRLIPQKKGFYVLDNASELFSMDEYQDFEGKCAGQIVNAHVNLNSGADNNVNMLHNSPDPHLNQWVLADPKNRYHRFGSYCFYVTE